MFAVGWVITASILQADRLLVAALIATVGFLTGILLHKMTKHLAARLIWLCSANIAVFLASIVTPPAGNMSTIFIAIAAIPFVVFRLRNQRRWIIALVVLPMALWLTSWAEGFRPASAFDVQQDVAETILAPASAFTTFGVVLFVIGYFVRTSEDQLRNIVMASRELRLNNEATMRLLESLSHEMRTPLQAIYGYAELIQKDTTLDAHVREENAKQYSTRVLRACLELLHVLDNIFDFVRRPDRAAEPECENVDLKAEIDQLVRHHVNEIDIKQLRARVEIESPIVFRSDRGLVRQVIKQIIDNAVKFSPDGGEVVITCTDDADKVTVVVRDSGPGFPQGAAKRAFIPFERLGYETSTTPGVGIGLALARDAAERLGGEVVIKEDGTTGGTVHVVLPKQAVTTSNAKA